MLFRSSCLFLALVTALAACSSTLMSTDAALDVASTADAAPIDAAPATDVPPAIDMATDGSTTGDTAAPTLQGQVIYDSYNGQANIPVRGAAVAIMPGGVSATTDDRGGYALAAPTNTSFVLGVALPGEISLQRVLIVPSGGATVDLHTMDIDAYVGSVSHVGGNTDAFDFGVVAVRFEGSTQGGYGATISAAHGGSLVFANPGLTGAMASATTRVAGDTLYFYTVTPGTTTLATSSPAGLSACSDTDAPGTVQYPVSATTMTEIVLHCR